MNMVNVVASAFKKGATPTLHLETRIGYSVGEEAVSYASGVLWSEDKIVLAHLHLHEDGNQRLDYPLHADTGSTRFNTSQVVLPFYAELTERALDLIDERRFKHPKGNVMLRAEFSFRILRPSVSLPNVQVGNGGTVLYKQTARNEHETRLNDMNLLSAKNHGEFAKMSLEGLQANISIASSDYVHDFLPSWRGGQFVLFEIPEPSVTVNDPAVKERLASALKDAHEARHKLLAGEWNDAIFNLRGVWELVRNEEQFKALLAADGYTKVAIDALNESVKQQFEFASKFKHKLDKEKKLMDGISAEKEDAYLVFSFAMSFLNLLARKGHRHGL